MTRWSAAGCTPRSMPADASPTSSKRLPASIRALIDTRLTVSLIPGAGSRTGLEHLDGRGHHRAQCAPRARCGRARGASACWSSAPPMPCSCTTCRGRSSMSTSRRVKAWATRATNCCACRWARSRPRVPEDAQRRLWQGQVTRGAPDAAGHPSPQGRLHLPGRTARRRLRHRWSSVYPVAGPRCHRPAQGGGGAARNDGDAPGADPGGARRGDRLRSRWACPTMESGSRTHLPYLGGTDHGPGAGRR